MDGPHLEDENGPLVLQPTQINRQQQQPANNNVSHHDTKTAAAAIRFHQASFGYNKKVPVLSDLHVRVPVGCIYGLLGPSGCGKTTLLQCIVGKRKLRSGDIAIFGGKPGSLQAGVPGPRVGYMPQELALFYEFTIEETLSYFGNIFGMSASLIRKRTTFLKEFLDLPRSKRLVREMSGGQQRRVSLAAALLHQPPLLILDEPTVGVDPLLRQCIWDHLLEISRGDQVCTIVITTHYIEEARQADMVGMMRYGRLLAEDSPQNLLSIYGKTSLESVFLHLCLQDDPGSDDERNDGDGHLKMAEGGRGHLVMEESTNRGSLGPSSETKEWPDNPMKSSSSNSWVAFHRLRALLVKNFIRMWRNLGFLTFQFIIPTVQVALFCLAIGREPRGLSIAVVNHDADIVNQCQFFTSGCILGNKDEFMGLYDGYEGHKRNLSCRFLSYIDNGFLRPVYFSDLSEALSSVRRGHHWGVMEFRENYTDALYDRMFGMAELRPPSNETLETSDVHVYLDMTNQQIGYTIQLRLGEAYQDFAKDLLSSCQMPNQLAALPIAFEPPVYGSNEPTFTEFMAPGVILSITYFMAVGLTALSFIIERKEGLLERSWVAGVTATEVMLAHVVAQFAVMVVQVALVLIFMIFVFQVPSNGPMSWVIGLTLLQGLCGMAFGLVVSALCDNEQDAIQLALGSFYPNLLLSGIIWPLEGMLPELRYISYVLPQTYACEAMRGMLSRGWGIEWPQVYVGYLVTLAWTVIQLILSAFILKVRR